MKTVKVKSAHELFIEELQKTLSRAYSERPERIKHAMKSRIDQGYSLFRPPLGYEKTEVRGLFRPTELGYTIGSTLQALADGDISLPNAIYIIQGVLEAGTDKKATNDKVLRLLGNPYYAGILFYQGNQYMGKHEPLITIERHETILRLLNRFTRKVRG